MQAGSSRLGGCSTESARALTGTACGKACRAHGAVSARAACCRVAVIEDRAQHLRSTCIAPAQHVRSRPHRRTPSHVCCPKEWQDIFAKADFQDKAGPSLADDGAGLSMADKHACDQVVGRWCHMRIPIHTLMDSHMHLVQRVLQLHKSLRQSALMSQAMLLSPSDIVNKITKPS